MKQEKSLIENIIKEWAKKTKDDRQQLWVSGKFYRELVPYKSLFLLAKMAYKEGRKSK